MRRRAMMTPSATLGGSLEFDDVDDYIEVPLVGITNQSSFSVSALFPPIQEYQRSYLLYNLNYSFLLAVHTQNQQGLFFNFNVGGQTRTGTVDGDFIDGNEHVFTTIKENGIYRLYVDGTVQPVFDIGDANDPPFVNDNVFIGRFGTLSFFFHAVVKYLKFSSTGDLNDLTNDLNARSDGVFIDLITQNLYSNLGAGDLIYHP